MLSVFSLSPPQVVGRFVVEGVGAGFAASPGARGSMPSVEDLWATRQLDASRIPLSMRNDSALASRWFWSLCHGKLGRETNGGNQIARISLTAHFLVVGKTP